MNYIILLSFDKNEVIKIKLTENQKKQIEKLDDNVDEFLSIAFPEIDLSNTFYMCVDDIKEKYLGF